MKKIMCENGCSQYIWIIHSDKEIGNIFESDFFEK